MVIPSLFPFARHRWIQRKDACTTNLRRDLVNSGLCQMFTLAEIKKATEDFSEYLEIGASHPGKFYRGFINGREGARKEVTIWRVNSLSEWELLWFKTEIEMLSRLRHRNLISLLGFCLENKEKIIVYDCMARGTLRQHLYGTQMPPLPWNLRLEICIGAARCLQYLHAEATSHVIIHRDVNTGDILLDSNWDTKITGLGISKVCYMQETNHVTTSVVGTFGYLDPEYVRTGQLSEKSDVYSLGVVLLEVLCARSPFNDFLPDNECCLVDWAQYCLQHGTLEEMIDPYLEGKITPQSLGLFAETATMCLADHGIDRPTIGDVIRNLECALHLQERTAVVTPSTSAHNKPEIADVGPMNMSTYKFVQVLPPCRYISLKNIKRATNNFDENCRIGGEFSRIYKGHIVGANTPNAIKRAVDRNKFQTEIMVLSRLCHRNIVSLVGCCNKFSEMILIYDYMALGNLQQHLYNPEIAPLTWTRRLHICIGVARALNYIHHGACSEVIIHRDVNTANILLDDDFVPKLSGFGRQEADLESTIGYIDPEYFRDGQLTEKSDVYSFGVMLFEVLCARRPRDVSLLGEQVNPATRALHCQQNGIMEEFIDPHLRKKVTPECFEVFVEVAKQCLADRREDRPTMKKVLRNLESALQLQVSADMDDFCCKIFTFAEIRKATNDFDEILHIGEGTFGKVYRGAIEGGATHVAIKRANPKTRLKFCDYRNEIEMLFNLRHHHLVSFIGCCVKELEIILVYNYMAHGSLQDHLYKSQKPPLLWKKRLEICIGAARGLHYLHTGATVGTIVHGAVRTCNILLDYKWVSKLSDIGPLTRGSTQDLDDFPKSEKSDVFSFGLVLFETLCGRPSLDRSLPGNKAWLARWALHCYENDTVEEIIDPHLKGKIRPECLKKFVETAVKCLADRSADRPKMGDVVSDLQLALRLQELSDAEDVGCRAAANEPSWLGCYAGAQIFALAAYFKITFPVVIFLWVHSVFQLLLLLVVVVFSGKCLESISVQAESSQEPGARSLCKVQLRTEGRETYTSPFKYRAERLEQQPSSVRLMPMPHALISSAGFRLKCSHPWMNVSERFHYN